VFDARVTVPFDGTPVATVTVGVPAVPGGTVIVIESSNELLAVVNVYAYAIPVAPVAKPAGVQIGLPRTPPVIAIPAVTPLSTGPVPVFDAMFDV
jgi:hypothetical protein